MDFEYNEEQTLLRDTTRDVLTKFYDLEKLRDVTDTDLGWSRDVWKSLGEIGILGLSFSEEDGGMGAGPEEISAVLGEFGRALAPEPLLDAVLIPGGLIADVGSADQKSKYLPQLASGDLLGAFAHTEPGDRWPHTAVKTTATASGDGHTLTGRKNPVLHGDCADVLVVSARLDDEIRLFLVDADAQGLTRTDFRTHDSRRGAEIDLQDAPATLLDSGDTAAALVKAEVVAQVALCAEAVGAMEQTLRLTTDYLKQRKQFGVPLAKFQALTHRAADMYVLVELARSLSLYATVTLAEGEVDPVIASRAKLQVCRSARKVGQEAIQMHGGIGITAEYPVGHYVSRLLALEHTLGGAADHLRTLSDQVGDYDKILIG
ncbi:acyl-CoA dehydrogenase family protein [Williamsia sp. 1135]|uniref:acyl-CoA dehydrogenase family protein n=1 Tax=Williamsia sp. 1135 TaxID=1889262 RepID=UPI000A0F4C52|nr:acyl-CoA dehydrogenase family protein [Williamsia sp. 1135]ORM26931.1 acyl-CoA dehydrogenase [Williamsia sp. 1135]